MECLMFSTLWNKYHESFNTDVIFTPEDIFYVIKYGGPGVREQELWILIYPPQCFTAILIITFGFQYFLT